jgi:hypothetical protein
MKLRHLFTVNIFIAIFFGGTCAFLPRFVSSLYGIVPDDAAIWVTRLAGGSIWVSYTDVVYIKTLSRCQKSNSPPLSRIRSFCCLNNVSVDRSAKC